MKRNIWPSNGLHVTDDITDRECWVLYRRWMCAAVSWVAWCAWCWPSPDCVRQPASKTGPIWPPPCRTPTIPLRTRYYWYWPCNNTLSRVILGIFNYTDKRYCDQFICWLNKTIFPQNLSNLLFFEFWGTLNWF